jgi:hypothetical protein
VTPEEILQRCLDLIDRKAVEDRTRLYGSADPVARVDAFLALLAAHEHKTGQTWPRRQG